MKAKTQRFAACLLIVALAVPLPPARAEMLTTNAALSSDRERITALLERDEARAQLLAHGVDPAQARARIAALSDEEAAVLAKQMETLPAGARGDALFYLIVAIVLLPVIVVGGAIFLAVKAISSLSANAHEDSQK